ncbi:hypothetical protein ACF06X_33650 [Streptomyces sp. NPDC015346]|uniref:hypothetical protein n=1 Tax=Streptomyces sp. NPDC015346 TaxID=3364954 RepID=UPI0036FC1C47
MTDQTTNLRDQIAEALMSWAEHNGNPQYASLRRPETVRQNAYGRADAVLKALTAAGVRAVQPDACTCGHPRDRHITCCTECFCIKFTQAGPRRAAAAVRDAAPEEMAAEQLVHVGWWCWRGNPPGHLAAQACRSDNVPIHVPAEWADDMRAVIQRIEDGDDDTPAVGGQDAGQPAEATAPADLPERLRAVLTERYADTGNPFSRMVINYQGPDGWPATKPVGADLVAEVLRELLADEASTP